MSKTIYTHKHHIIPRHVGGTDDIYNHLYVTPEGHYQLHYERWLKFGEIGDLAACQLLQKNHLRLTKEERRKVCSAAGKKSGQMQFEKKINIHSQTKEERLKLSSKGGQNGAFSKSYALRNGITEKERIQKQSERGKRGGPKNKGFCWITDGKTSIKYTKPMQEKESVNDYIINNPSFRKGRTDLKPLVICPHCDKSGRKSAMVLHHFNKCKLKGNK